MAGGDICGDNRFEIIARAKQSILEGTNIDTSPDEMKVLDNFLFRCWQMDWLDCYDENKKNDAVLFEIRGLIQDININEITTHIAADNLAEWITSWRKAIEATLAELGGKA